MPIELYISINNDKIMRSPTKHSELLNQTKLLGSRWCASGSIKHRRSIAVVLFVYFLLVGTTHVVVGTSPELRTWLLPIQAISVAWGFSVSFLIVFQCARLSRYSRTTAQARRQIAAYVRARRQLELRQRQSRSTSVDERNAATDDLTVMATSRLKRRVVQLRVERTKTEEQRQLEELQRQVAEEILTATIAITDEQGESLAAAEALTTLRRLAASTSSTSETDSVIATCYDNDDVVEETAVETWATGGRESLPGHRRSLQPDTDDDDETLIRPLRGQRHRHAQRCRWRRRRHQRPGQITSGRIAGTDSARSSKRASYEAEKSNNVVRYRTDARRRIIGKDSEGENSDGICEIRLSDVADISRPERSDTAPMAERDADSSAARITKSDRSTSPADNENNENNENDINCGSSTPIEIRTSDLIPEIVQRALNDEGERMTMTSLECVGCELNYDEDDVTAKKNAPRHDCVTSSMTSPSDLNDGQWKSSAVEMAVRCRTPSAATDPVEAATRKTCSIMGSTRHRLRFIVGQAMTSSVTSLLRQRNRNDDGGPASGSLVTLTATVESSVGDVSVSGCSPSELHKKWRLRCFEHLKRHHHFGYAPSDTGAGIKNESVAASSIIDGDVATRRVPSSRHWLGRWMHRRRLEATIDQTRVDAGASTEVFHNRAFDIHSDPLTSDVDDGSLKDVDGTVDRETSGSDVEVMFVDDYDADSEFDHFDDDVTSGDRNQSSPTTTITAEVRLPFPINIAFPGCLGLRRIRYGRRIRLIARVSCVTLTSALCACVLNVYAMLGVFSVLSNARPAAPWAWLAFQTLCR